MWLENYRRGSAEMEPSCANIQDGLILGCSSCHKLELGLRTYNYRRILRQPKEKKSCFRTTGQVLRHGSCICSHGLSSWFIRLLVAIANPTVPLTTIGKWSEKILQRRRRRRRQRWPPASRHTAQTTWQDSVFPLGDESLYYTVEHVAWIGYTLSQLTWIYFGKVDRVCEWVPKVFCKQFLLRQVIRSKALSNTIP